MPQNLLARLLPPPAFLSMPTFGIDVSEESIKTALFKETSFGLELDTVTEHFIPEGVMVDGRIAKPEALAALLRDLAGTYGIRFAAMAVPEDSAFIVGFNLPAIASKEVKEAVELQLEERVPISVKDAVFDVEVSVPPGPLNPGWQVVATVVSDKVSQSYVDSCRQAGILLRALEMESHALARSLVKRGDPDTYMIVDFGRRRTSFAVVVGGVVEQASTAVSLGGDALTKTILKNLETTYDEAELLKTTKGLLHTAKTSDLFFAMMSHVSSLRDEINRRVDYWQTKKDGRVASTPIKQVILCGGQASLLGLIEYLNETLDLPVALGNPWINILSESSVVPPLSKQESLKFGVAIGLAMRHLPYVN